MLFFLFVWHHTSIAPCGYKAIRIKQYNEWINQDMVSYNYMDNTRTINFLLYYIILYYIILYLLVILIILYLYLFLRNIDSFIVNDDKWIDYRLGDILSGYCLKKEHHYIKYVKSKHNDTIGKRYLNAIKYKTQSLNQVIITKIIKEHIKNNNIKIDNNLIILNLRVGDVITNDNFNNQQVFARNKRIYYYKKDNYNLICQYLKKKISI